MGLIKGMIAGRIERLEELIAVHEEIAGEEAIELADAASFDPGPEAERLRRSQAAKSAGAEADAGAVPEDAGGRREAEAPGGRGSGRAVLHSAGAGMRGPRGGGASITLGRSLALPGGLVRRDPRDASLRERRGAMPLGRSLACPGLALRKSSRTNGRMLPARHNVARRNGRIMKIRGPVGIGSEGRS